MSKQRKQPESSKNITKLLDDSIRNLNKVKQYLAKNETVKSDSDNDDYVKPYNVTRTNILNKRKSDEFTSFLPNKVIMVERAKLGDFKTILDAIDRTSTQKLIVLYKICYGPVKVAPNMIKSLLKNFTGFGSMSQAELDRKREFVEDETTIEQLSEIVKMFNLNEKIRRKSQIINEIIEFLKKPHDPAVKSQSQIKDNMRLKPRIDYSDQLEVLNGTDDESNNRVSRSRSRAKNNDEEYEKISDSSSSSSSSASSADSESETETFPTRYSTRIKSFHKFKTREKRRSSKPKLDCIKDQVVQLLLTCGDFTEAEYKKFTTYVYDMYCDKF